MIFLDALLSVSRSLASPGLPLQDNNQCLKTLQGSLKLNIVSNNQFMGRSPVRDESLRPMTDQLPIPFLHPMLSLLFDTAALHPSLWATVSVK